MISSYSLKRARLYLYGTIQGVGFRPMIYRLAQSYQLSGFIFNDGNGVIIEIEGTTIEHFLKDLPTHLPPLAKIDSIRTEWLPLSHEVGFQILTSQNNIGKARPTPDAMLCSECKEDILNPQSRFYHYPFTTCPNCGPRYSITDQLPIDRINTVMRKFPLCPECLKDYNDPNNRRFHAQMISCPNCGPQLNHSLDKIVEVLKSGGIIALKGIGAFHLVCDAYNEATLQKLRLKKHRPYKPFAVMVKDLEQAKHLAVLSPEEENLLLHPANPIVLVRYKPGQIAPSVAPKLNQIGILLPPSALHFLLLEKMEMHTVLVMTSANISGYPPIIDYEEAQQYLSEFCDLIVDHNRPILRRIDDSVVQWSGFSSQILRRSRGWILQPIPLYKSGPNLIALGSQKKATICLARGKEAFLSQHIGDLDHPSNLRFHQQVAFDLMDMLHTQPDHIICDAHPDTPTLRTASAIHAPILRIQHHIAHIGAVAAQHGLAYQPLLGVALDGYGYGDQGEAWGGELLFLDQFGKHQRFGHLYPLLLLGGDRAAKSCWRMGISAMLACKKNTEAKIRFSHIPFASSLIEIALSSPDFFPKTSSLGRLFEAAASILQICEEQSYEGQAAMWLQSLANNNAAAPLKHGWKISQNHILDFRPLLLWLIQQNQQDLPGCSAIFHATLAVGIAEWITQAACQFPTQPILLSGGCMANTLLSQRLVLELQNRGLTPLLPMDIPPGDGGLSLGQIWIARMQCNGQETR